MNITQEQIEKAILWFKSMGYYAESFSDTIRLECEGFSVVLDPTEVEDRAEQWDWEQNRRD